MIRKMKKMPYHTLPQFPFQIFTNPFIIKTYLPPKPLPTMLKPILLTLFITLSLTQNLFNTSPIKNLLLSSSAKVVKISGLGNSLIAGYNNGTMVNMNLAGVYEKFQTTQTNPIAQIITYQNYVAALDTGSNLMAWDVTNPSSMLAFLYIGGSGSVTNIALRATSNSIIGSANFGSSIVQYQYSSSGFKAGLTFTIPGVTITSTIYSVDGSLLVVGTSSNLIQFISTSSGTVSSNVIQISGFVTQFSILNNQNIIALTSTSKMYWINTYDFTYQTLTTIPTTTAFVGCPSNLIATGQSSNSNINVYLQNGNSIQTLNYAKNTVVSIDCSSNYLVTLDNSGYIAINNYSDISIQTLAGWIIAIIVVFSVLCLVGVAVCIWCCCRRRNLALQVSLNNTSKELHDTITYKHQLN